MPSALSAATFTITFFPAISVTVIDFDSFASTLCAGVDIAVGGAAVCPLGPEAVGVVGIRPGGSAVGHSDQFPAADVGNAFMHSASRRTAPYSTLCRH